MNFKTWLKHYLQPLSFGNRNSASRFRKVRTPVENHAWIETLKTWPASSLQKGYNLQIDEAKIKTKTYLLSNDFPNFLVLRFWRVEVRMITECRLSLCLSPAAVWSLNGSYCNNVPRVVKNKDNIFTTEGMSEQKILICHQINERVSEANEWDYGDISIFFVNEWLKKWKYYLYFEPRVAHWHYFIGRGCLYPIYIYIKYIILAILAQNRTKTEPKRTQNEPISAQIAQGSK